MIDVYVAVPYSHDDPEIRQERFEVANRYTAKLMRQGLVCFSPITMCHPVAAYGLPGDFAFWEKLNYAYLDLCREIHVLKITGWRDSIGVTAEIQIMRDLGRIVRFVSPAMKGVPNE